jgi:T-complex protein 1 subunit zeta
LDLFMVEIQTMEHRLDSDTKLVRGLVLDHGPRHPDMKTKMKNCYILTCNVSLEYEKSELNSQFMVTDPNKRQEIIEAERRTIDDRCRQIIALKNKVCTDDSKNFVVVNQKGIDPMSLDMLAKAGITALRRAKRRNMERLTLCCGGVALNSFDGMDEKALGFAADVYEEILGEEKYTFIEGVTNPHSCTILIKAPNKFSIQQIKDSIRDGLRAVKNAIEDECVVPGAGAFEIMMCQHLLKYADTVKGKPSIGVKCFAESLLIIPKTLAVNSGLDPLDCVLTLEQEFKSGHVVGLDLFSGECVDPVKSGIFDNFRVKEQILESSAFTACQLLYVDEILSAGKSSQKGGEGMQQ